MTEVQFSGVNGRTFAVSTDILTALRPQLRGSLFLKDESGYDEARTIWDALIDRRPGAVVRCRGASDVFGLQRRRPRVVAAIGSLHALGLVLRQEIVVDKPEQPVLVEPERPAESVAGLRQREGVRRSERSPRGGDLDIGQWLRDLGLQAYEQAFRDNGVDLDVLPRLTADDLKEIGVSAVGHRRKILDAVGELGGRPGQRRSKKAPDRAERRQLTVMFCDLVGSTALSASLDPEDMQDLLRIYHARVGDLASKHGGFVAKYMGDGALIYFGFPQAHEDDAERAVRAGLALVEGVSELMAGGECLNARVGIATGLVVVGDLVGTGEVQERGIAGETPNLAARLQVLAEAGAVVISDTTRRLVGDLFELCSLAPTSLKGFAEPVQAWRVIGEGKAESRFEALHGKRITPLVGREEELDLVVSRWRQVKEGSGHVVLISGEPGIGKSRLVLALRERLQGEPKTSLSYACSPHHANSALFPFVTQLERAAGFAPDDTWETRLDKLKSLLQETTAKPNNAVALFADLLGIPAGSRHPLAAMSSLQKKGLLFRAFLAQLEALAVRCPVLVVLEDVHWLDPTSRELFDQIVERLQRLPVLLVGTFRPELSPPWMGFPHVTLLTLNRLAHAQARSLVERVTGGKALPAGSARTDPCADGRCAALHRGIDQGCA